MPEPLPWRYAAYPLNNPKVLVVFRPGIGILCGWQRESPQWAIDFGPSVEYNGAIPNGVKPIHVKSTGKEGQYG
jgi:hypothetical protein